MIKRAMQKTAFHDEMTASLKAIRKLLPDEVCRCQVIYSGRAASGSEGVPFMPFED